MWIETFTKILIEMNLRRCDAKETPLTSENKLGYFPLKIQHSLISGTGEYTDWISSIKNKSFFEKFLVSFQNICLTWILIRVILRSDVPTSSHYKLHCIENHIYSIVIFLHNTELCLLLVRTLVLVPHYCMYILMCLLSRNPIEAWLASQLSNKMWLIITICFYISTNIIILIYCLSELFQCFVLVYFTLCI